MDGSRSTRGVESGGAKVESAGERPFGSPDPPSSSPAGLCSWEAWSPTPAVFLCALDTCKLPLYHRTRPDWHSGWVFLWSAFEPMGARACPTPSPLSSRGEGPPCSERGSGAGLRCCGRVCCDAAVVVGGSVVIGTRLAHKRKQLDASVTRPSHIHHTHTVVDIHSIYVSINLTFPSMFSI